MKANDAEQMIAKGMVEDDSYRIITGNPPTSDNLLECLKEAHRHLEALHSSGVMCGPDLTSAQSFAQHLREAILTRNKL